MVRRDARPPRKVSARSWSAGETVDAGFFVIATGLVLWFGWLLLTKELALSWSRVWYVVVFWLLTAYVGLPRLQQVLAKIYVPDYFIGRTLTSSGILGDPVNLAFDGSPDQVHSAMRRAGWTLADDLTLRSSWGIVVSAVFHRSDTAAPVSPLFLFGRREAFAYEQQVGGSASHRHHVRFWPAPAHWVLPGGRRVGWLAAGTFDRAVGLSLFTLQVTHKVDADIDAERDHVVQTVTEHVEEARSEVLEDFVSAFHSRNGGGDVVRTDGDLVVLDLTAVPVTPDAADQASPPSASWWASRLPAPALLLAGALGLVKAVGGVLSGGVPALVSAAVIALWVATLARQAWARTLLMVACTVDAAVQLAAFSETEGHPSLARLVYAGASALILVAVSSDEVRRWVDRTAASGVSR